MAADADWDALKVEYVTGKMSYRSLAQAHGVPLSTLERRARGEKWADERRKYAGTVTKGAIKRAGKREINRLAKLQAAGTRMSTELERLMRDANRQLYTHVSEKDGELTENKLHVVDEKKLLSISRSIDVMARAMRSLYDIQTQAEKLRQEQEGGETEVTVTMNRTGEYTD